MTPADIARAELRAGLARRLAELGPRAARSRRDPPGPGRPGRFRRGRAEGRMSTVAALQGGAPARPALRPAAVLAVASASSFLVYLDATIVNVAFPDVRASFAGATLAGLSWILSAYGIVFAALLVPGGRLADVVGGRRLFLAGLAAFTLGSALCALAPSVELLVVARVLQAAGGALLVPASQLLVMAAHPPEQRMKVLGAMAAVAALASALGPVLGGLAVELGGWRLVFLVNLPIGIAALAAGRRMPPRRRPAAPRGARTCSGRCSRSRRSGSLALGAVQGPVWGWGGSARRSPRSPPPRCSRRSCCGAARAIPRPCSSSRCSARVRSAPATSARCCWGRASSASCWRTRSSSRRCGATPCSRAGLAIAPGPLASAVAAIARRASPTGSTRAASSSRAR